MRDASAHAVALALLLGLTAWGRPANALVFCQKKDKPTSAVKVRLAECKKNEVDATSELESQLAPRGYGRVRVVGVIPATSYWDMAFDGPHPGFLSARTPGGGITCLRPDPAVLTPEDVTGGVLTDASGNDTRAYFDGSFACDADEARVVQKVNSDGSPTNQPFNIVVP